MHYPTKEYQTYADCDQDYVRRTLPSDLVPFWNVDNISQASSFWESDKKEIWQKANADTQVHRYIEAKLKAKQIIHFTQKERRSLKFATSLCF